MSHRAMIAERAARVKLSGLRAEWASISVSAVAEHLAIDEQAVLRAARRLKMPVVPRAGGLWILGAQPRTRRPLQLKVADREP